MSETEAKEGWKAVALQEKERADSWKANYERVDSTCTKAVMASVDARGQLIKARGTLWEVRAFLALSVTVNLAQAVAWLLW